MSIRIRRLFAVASLVALTGAAGGVWPSAACADTTSTLGWVRLAHLSPDTAPVDVYLYPYGGSSPQVVLKHVAYGTLSPYQSLAPGDYLVAMRSADAPATTSPVISTQVDVAAGQAYTVAGLGRNSALTLQVLSDRLDAPAGKASVRVIEASLLTPTVSIVAGSNTVASGLHFPNASGYQALAAGQYDVAVETPNAVQTTHLSFSADSTYTLAILDGSGDAPRVLDLGDATGTGVMPKGGVSTGFGGTAAKTARTAKTADTSGVESGGTMPSPVLWVLLTAALLGMALRVARRRWSAG